MRTPVKVVLMIGVWVILSAWAVLPTRAEPCEPAWEEGVFCPLGMNGAVLASTTWDDGSGEAVYVGGDFSIAECATQTGSVARWDGLTWTALVEPDGNAGVDGTVSALAVFDDGTGSALYVAGAFTEAGGETARNIAKWDGSTWTPLTGPGGTDLDGAVRALAVFDDGNGPALYAGGDFVAAGGEVVNHIARWDGLRWSALVGVGSPGVSGWVDALAVYNDGTGPALYAGGAFDKAGDMTVESVARWDGVAWTALEGSKGTGVSGQVYALSVFDDGSGIGPSLYIGGNFFRAGGETVNRIARWNGADWSPLVGPDGTGAGYSGSDTVRSLTTFDDGAGPVLVVGGRFFRAGGLLSRGIATWDGARWGVLEDPGGLGVSECVNGFACNPSVYALTVYNSESGPSLFVGGDFLEAGEQVVRRMARWSGETWSPVTGAGDARLMGCTGTFCFGESASAGDVNAFEVFDDGTGEALYAGGGFLTAGGVLVNRIARWDGTSWSALEGSAGTGMDDIVDALAVFDDGTGPALYAGGKFQTAGGRTVNGVARWNGSEWFALEGPNANGVGWVSCLAVYDDGNGPALYVGGQFTTVGGETFNRVARWDGSSWSALTGPGGTGVLGLGVETMTVFDDGGGPALYVGGNFDTAGGVTVNNIAMWDGAEWLDLSGPNGIGMHWIVSSLEVFDDGNGPDLYAGGWFNTAGGIDVNGIARWDGNEWSSLAGPAGIGMSGGGVEALAVLDDGSLVGPALIAGGWFHHAGGQMVNGVARWSEAGWEPLPGPNGTGVDGHVIDLAAFDSGDGQALYAGGYFFSAGGIGATGISKWTGCPDESPCPPDFNDDGLLDLADVVAFVVAFSNNEPAADLAEPFGTFDFADISAFTGSFLAGCP